MKDIIVGIIKKWGVKLVLSEIADVLMSGGNEKEKQLARDIREALDRFKSKNEK